jgi:hypothetical protein
VTRGRSSGIPSGADSSLRLASPLLAALVLAGCAPVVVQIADGPLEGPQLAIQVANASEREVEVSYDYEAVNTGGGGGGSVASCEQVSIPFGAVAGQYRVLVDGEAVHEAAAPAGPADAWFVVRVSIGPDGDAEVIGAGMTARMPDPDPRAIAGGG